LTVTAHNLEGYDAPAIEWERVRELTSTDVTHAPDTGGPNRHTSWLTTIGEDRSAWCSGAELASVAKDYNRGAGPVVSMAKR
jgi:hypothetical protein